MVLMIFAASYGYGRNEDTTHVYSLEEVVVTATRNPKRITETGKSVTLITDEQTKGMIHHDVSDLLTSEGLTIVGAGQNYGANESIFLRGANSNQTVIMIDNIRITDPSSVNNAPDLSELSLAGIDQIEIVRGVNSSLYGSSSIGGVVNCISRRYGKQGWNLDAGIDAGAFGTRTSLHRENLYLNYLAPMGWYVTGEFMNTDVQGLDATIDTNTNPSVYNRRDRDNSNQQDYIGTVGFLTDVWDIYGSFRRIEQRKDLDKRAYLDDNNYTLDYNRNLYSYGIKYTLLPNLQVKALGGFSRMNRDAVDDSSIIDNQGTYDHTFASDKYSGYSSTNEVQISVNYPGFEAIVGGSYYRESMSVNSYYYSGSPFGIYEYTTVLSEHNLRTSTSSAFFRVEAGGMLLHYGLENLTIAFGGNAIHHTEFGSWFVYEFNPTLKLNQNSLLFVSLSTGFTAPSLYQLYAPARDAVSGITRGNNHLQPEQSHSFEFGVKHTPAKGTEFTISYFRTVTDDMIEYVYLWDRKIGIDTLGNDWMRNDYRGDTYLNLGTQTTQGIEINVTSALNEIISVSAGISLVDGKLAYDPSALDTSWVKGNHVQSYNTGTFLTKHSESIGLIRRPSVATFRLEYKPVSMFSARMEMRYVSRRGDVYYDSNLGPFGALGTVPLPEYLLVDYSAKVVLGDILVGMRLENAFNTKYSEIKGFTTRGRGVYASVRYSI